MAYTYTWDSSFEGSPADSDDASEGATKIRNLKNAIRERMETDHYWDEAGTDADHGEHTKVTLRTTSSPTEGADKGYLFAKDVDSKAELHWRDEDGNELQLTAGGSFSLGDGTGITATDAEINTVADGSTARNSHVHSNISVSSGTGLSGGGSLGSNRTISISSGGVGQTQIASNAVGTGELKTATGEVSTSTKTSGSNFTLPGGSYGFYPQIQFSTGSSGGTGVAWGADLDSVGISTIKETAYLASSSTSSYTARIYIHGYSTDSSWSAKARQRYIQSSPPYNLGDGVVQGFVYVHLDSNGNIMGTYIAEDPPWYGNTKRTPTRQYVGEDGKEYAEFKQSKYQRTSNLEDFGVIETITKEITPEVKNEGMELVPHPFDEKTGLSIVLLDLVDEDILPRIVNEMLCGGEPQKILQEGYIKIDNMKMEKRKGPPGVAIHKARWRNTKG